MIAEVHLNRITDKKIETIIDIIVDLFITFRFQRG